MKRRIFVLVLAAAMLISLLPALAQAVSGVPAGYTAVSTPEDLDAIRYNLSGKYFLTNDIDLTAALSSGGSLYTKSGWIALGYESGGSKAFSGVIDGNGHTIKGYYSSSSASVCGFVYENAGTIKNLTIAGSVKNFGATYGTICNTNKGLVQNCHNKVSILSSTSMTYWASHYIGAIVGDNLGKIEYCSNLKAIEASSTNYGGSGDKMLYIGGIAGKNSGTINACWNTAEISGKATSGLSVISGGVAGYCVNDIKATYTLSVSNSYNSGAVKTVNTSSWSGLSGGIIGEAESGVTVPVSNCYNAGKVSLSSQTPRYTGALAGLGNKITFSNCYYLSGSGSGAVNMSSKTGATALNESGMKTQSAFAGFDFTNVWVMGGYPYYYPVLRIWCTHTLTAVAAKEPGCETEGNIKYWYCSLCRQYFLDSSKKTEISREETVIPPAHKFGQYISDGNTTCTENGTKTARCENCDATDSIVEEGGHIFTNYIGNNDATCSKDGTKTAKCERCDITDTVVDEGSKQEHAAYTNGFCRVCGGGQEAPDTDGDGFYEISNAGQLYWFAQQAELASNNKQKINGKLMNNITVNRNVLTQDYKLNGDAANFRDWEAIWLREGVFDGNGFYISGLYVKNTNAYSLGFVDEMGSKAVIKNLGIIDSYFYGSGNVGAIAGRNFGTIYECYSDSVVSCSITGSGNLGGITGYCAGTVSDCYSIGLVSGGQYSIGGVVGDLYIGGSVKNCYHRGGVNYPYNGGGKGSGRIVGTMYDESTVTNCYYYGSSGGGIDGKDVAGSAERVNSSQMDGRITYLLNESGKNNIWKQTLSETIHPSFRGEDVYMVQTGGCTASTYTYGYSNENTAVVTHKEKTIPGKNASCIMTGLSDGKQCTVCGKITEEQTILPMTDHTFQGGKCTVCEEPDPDYHGGDVDLDGDVDVDDVLTLLWHVLFPDDYTIEVNADFDENGSVDVDDVLTLLWHVLFPDDYPLN